jgi:hypothetical protein
MAAQTLTNSQVLLGAYDITSFTGQLDTGSQVAMREAPNLGAYGFRITTPGIHSSEQVFTGNDDYDTAGAVGRVLTVAQRGAQLPFGVVHAGTAASAGSSALLGQGLLSKLSRITGATGDVAGFQATITGDQPLVYGVVGATLASRGALTGTSIQLGAVGTGSTGVAQRLWAALFVTAASGTNLAVTIQSDNATGFPSAATAITFSTVSAASAQFTSVAGPITDDWFRVVATVGSGTFTYAVLMGVY